MTIDPAGSMNGTAIWTALKGHDASCKESIPLVKYARHPAVALGQGKRAAGQQVGELTSVWAWY
jgi:hypothetical protein